ncbi:nickel-dependent hydrogenase large subunit [Telmatospirillum sp.]|uniref:nickel-dependent hydrogenase large subunit n=1 Tax=Telmatospirillum sp. TaxID=2079197 RepID=UPI0028520AC4|nr:nickel-dependent hydrogenase large subunit [Telmatospirillum sp.]MDR3435183.1 nickel-dependent hydrogenase large subunit [Telmatospirillum sp.]
MTGTPAEGAIHIRLGVEAGLFSKVVIGNHRILRATAPLAGRSGDDVPDLVARLFSVCRIAQGVASVSAIEGASAVRPDGRQKAARHFLIQSETLLEHAGRACLDWTRLLGEAPLVAVLKRLRSALVDLPDRLFPDGDWLRPGGGRLLTEAPLLTDRLTAVAEAVDQAILGRFGDDGIPVGDATILGRLAGKFLTDGVAGFGAMTIGPLPIFEAGPLDARLAADADGGFIARPDWGGMPYLTGPLARRWDHPAVRAVIARHGSGLLAHVAARAVEMAATLREMQDFAQGLCKDTSSQSEPADGGLAVVEAARGRLVHRVELDAGKVMRYQILAPTEWNFHPNGPLVQGLLGHPAGVDPVSRAGMLVTALDPCVAFRVEML